MSNPPSNDRLLNQIMVLGFSLAFGVVVASLEALRATPSGFMLTFTWGTLLSLVVATGLLLPCFYIIVCSRSSGLRRAALLLVSLLGLGAFFYPMRVVPHEKYRPVFLGLAVALCVLSVIGRLLFLLARFFERDQDNASSQRPGEMR